MKNLPESAFAIGEYLRANPQLSIAAVAVSKTPRDVPGSYMPCFLSGVATAEFISGIITLYDNPMNYNWVIELKSEKTVIGNINFHSISNRNERVELGFCMGSRWWNKGLMTEAVGTAIRFAFEQLGAYKVCAEYQEENVASGKVMMKNKMIFEGRLRSHLKNKKGTFSDVLYYGILRDEWMERNSK